MKDALGTELQPGDLVADIRTGYAWSECSIVHGGLTKGGKIRVLSANGYKRNSQPKCLVKITLPQVQEWFERHLTQIRDYAERNPDYTYAQDRVISAENGFTKFLELHEKYNQ